MKDNLFLHQILYLRVIFLYFLSRGPKPDFNSPFFLFGIPVVAVLLAIVKYYTSFKEITWKDFVNLYLYRGVVSFYTYTGVYTTNTTTMSFSSWLETGAKMCLYHQHDNNVVSHIDGLDHNHDNQRWMKGFFLLFFCDIITWFLFSWY